MVSRAGDSERTGTGRPKVTKPKLTPQEIESRRVEHLQRIAGPAKIDRGGN